MQNKILNVELSNYQNRENSLKLVLSFIYIPLGINTQTFLFKISKNKTSLLFLLIEH